MTVFQYWQEQGFVVKENASVELLCSPAAWRCRHIDPGCSRADSSRCEHRWERRSSLLPSEDASCCKRRPGGGRLQTTDCRLSHIHNALHCTPPISAKLGEEDDMTWKRSVFLCIYLRCFDSHSLIWMCLPPLITTSNSLIQRNGLTFWSTYMRLLSTVGS